MRRSRTRQRQRTILLVAVVDFAIALLALPRALAVGPDSYIVFLLLHETNTNMGAIAKVIIRLRIPILIVVVLTTAALGYQLKFLSQDRDVLKFLPADDPDIQLFRQVSEEFGGLDVAIVGLESPRLLSGDGIRAVRAISRGALGVEGVYHTMAFTEMTHYEATEFAFNIEPLVPDVIPEDPERLREIRTLVMTDDLVSGRFVSADGQAALILCFLRSGAPLDGVATGIRAVVQEHSGHMRTYYGGLPFIQDHIGEGTRRDIIRLTPYVLLVAALATFIFFRRFLGSLLVLSSVALGAVWTIGGMALLGEQMTVVSTSLPMVLVAIGGAYGAHVLAAFYVANAPTASERVVEALREVGPPVVASVLTTVAGFSSFLIMDVRPMRVFGFVASIGVTLCALVALVVMPAVLSFGSDKAGRAAPAELLAEPIWRLCSAINRRKWAALLIITLVAAAAGSMAWRVTPDTSIKNFFRPDSEPALANRFMRDNFGGSMFVQVYVRADMRDPVVLDELRNIAEEAQTIDGVTRVTSHLQPLEKLAAGLGGLPRLPRTPAQVGGLQNFMAGNPALRQLVDDQLTRALVHVTIGTRDTKVVDGVVDHLRGFIEREIPNRVVPVDIYGTGAKVDAARARRLELVSNRIARLLRGAEQDHHEDAEARTLKVLQSRFGSWTLEPGEDLDTAMSETVHGFFNSDDSPFDPFDAQVTGAKLALLARRPMPDAVLAKALPGAVPAEVAADEEGMGLAIPVLAGRISETRAHVLSRRILDDVLGAVGLQDADEETRDLVRGALEELDDARVGLPTDGDGMEIEIGVTGTAVINRAFRGSTQRNQIRSLGIAIVALLILGIVMFWGMRPGLIVVAPSVLTLLITFGLMGWIETPLDPGTCMVAALSLGIGIDYAIHFVWRRRWRGLSFEQTCRAVGPAITFNAVEVASGFAVMILAETVPLSRFGLLVMFAMLVAAVATFTVLPALENRETTPDGKSGEGSPGT